MAKVSSFGKPKNVKKAKFTLQVLDLKSCVSFVVTEMPPLGKRLEHKLQKTVPLFLKGTSKAHKFINV